MVDFNSVLDHARQLSPQDQAKLIDALWNMVPEDVDLPLHPEWETELERRVMELRSETAQTIPWTRIHSETLARVHNGRVA